MTRRLSWTLVIAAATCAALAGFWISKELDSPATRLASGTWLEQPRQIGDFRLLDHQGREFTPRDLQGKPSLVFFGFTRCPDVCPTTLLKLAQVRKAAALPKLQVLFITVDPERDTPSALAPYVRAFDPSFIGLTGDATAIRRMTASFGVAASRVDLGGGNYTMDHSAAVFLLDTQGRIAAIFTPPFQTAPMAQDLRTAVGQFRPAS